MRIEGAAMKLPADIWMQLEALPLGVVVFVYRQLFGWVWDPIWHAPLPNPAGRRPYAIAWEPPLDYVGGKRFYVWMRNGISQWATIEPEPMRIVG